MYVTIRTAPDGALSLCVEWPRPSIIKIKAKNKRAKRQTKNISHFRIFALFMKRAMMKIYGSCNEPRHYTRPMLRSLTACHRATLPLCHHAPAPLATRSEIFSMHERSGKYNFLPVALSFSQLADFFWFRCHCISVEPLWESVSTLAQSI